MNRLVCNISWDFLIESVGELYCIKQNILSDCIIFRETYLLYGNQLKLKTCPYIIYVNLIFVVIVTLIVRQIFVHNKILYDIFGWTALFI